MYYQFDGLKIYFIATRNISIRPQDNLNAETDSQSISQLYISYIDEMLVVDERQRCLKSGYYFDCFCKRCLEDLQFNNLKYPFVINSELIECIDLIDEFFNSNYICDLIEYMAKNYNTNKMDIKSLALRKPNGETLSMIKKCKQQLSESYKEIFKKYSQLISTLDYNLIDSSLMIRIDDFFVCYQPNPNEIERIYQLYAKYYHTSRHPRMLNRIWCWIIFLLIQLWTEPDTSLNSTLLNTLQTLFRQLIMIRTYFKLNSTLIMNNNYNYNYNYN